MKMKGLCVLILRFICSVLGIQCCNVIRILDLLWLCCVVTMTFWISSCSSSKWYVWAPTWNKKNLLQCCVLYCSPQKTSEYFKVSLQNVFHLLPLPFLQLFRHFLKPVRYDNLCWFTFFWSFVSYGYKANFIPYFWIAIVKFSVNQRYLLVGLAFVVLLLCMKFFFQLVSFQVRKAYFLTWMHWLCYS